MPTSHNPFSLGLRPEAWSLKPEAWALSSLKSIMNTHQIYRRLIIPWILYHESGISTWVSAPILASNINFPHQHSTLQPVTYLLTSTYSSIKPKLDHQHPFVLIFSFFSHTSYPFFFRDDTIAQNGVAGSTPLPDSTLCDAVVQPSSLRWSHDTFSNLCSSFGATNYLNIRGPASAHVANLYITPAKLIQMLAYQKVKLPDSHCTTASLPSRYLVTIYSTVLTSVLGWWVSNSFGGRW